MNPITFDPLVQVIAYSENEYGNKLATVQFRQPRMIHSDFLTHRDFGRNGRSSRAVPVKKLLAEARTNPYMPHFMANQPGMVAAQEMSVSDRREAERVWSDMARMVADGVERLSDLGVHKQWSNRPLEWFGFIDVLVTATEWNNYFALRDHEATQPELQQVAAAIKAALAATKPRLLGRGEWHLPYIRDKDWDIADEFLKNGRIIRSLPTHEEKLELLKKISAARCARLTYEPFNGDGSFEGELNRYKRLIEDRPVHASPIEHQATPDTKSYFIKTRVDGAKRETVFEGEDWDNRHLHGNLVGFIQQRKLVAGEVVR